MKTKNKNKKTIENKPLSLSKSLRATIEDMGQVLDVKETLRKFDALQFERPKVYTRDDIVNLRKKKMHMSQAVFANVCNAKLSTVQKWERGITRPTPPVYRLFQLIEHSALDLVKA
ncbi:MAG: helix-turn-helix domain-containing protein [Fibrobacteres bacterium]|nr:helix-turn-helix domain-containing protein [Fibrobacterota bacterium]